MSGQGDFRDGVQLGNEICAFRGLGLVGFRCLCVTLMGSSRSPGIRLLGSQKIRHGGNSAMASMCRSWKESFRTTRI